MDLRQLRYFSAVFETKGMSRAAEAMGVAQSALSHHLANLEAELGVRLFDRQARGMDATPAGVRLYEHAQAILRSVAAAASDVASLAEELRGDIHVGLPFTVIDAVGVGFLQSMRARHPGANVIVQEALSSELQRQLMLGEIDIALCYNPLPDERVKLVHVHDEELCCAGRPDLLDDTSAPIDVEEALRLPQILLKRGAAARSISTQARLLQNLHSHAVLELNSVNGMQKALVAGIGVAVCPFITVRHLVEAGAVVVRPLRNPTSTRGLHLARLTERMPTRMMVAVQDELLARIREQTDDGRWPIVRP